MKSINLKLITVEETENVPEFKVPTEPWEPEQHHPYWLLISSHLVGVNGY